MPGPFQSRERRGFFEAQTRGIRSVSYTHLAQSHKDLPVRVYLASGTLEIDDPELEGIGHIVSGQARLSAALRGRRYPGLTLHSEMLQGLGHTDAPGTTAVRGMRLLYAW